MDAFFAQIEERENPRFSGKPIVVGADPKEGLGRGVVSTANYEARKYGIHSALPISKAYELCPSAIFLPVNMRLYEKASNNIMTIVKSYSNMYEVGGLDEAYLDISFCGDFEEAQELAKNLKQEIFIKEKLTSTIGVGPNKMISKIGSGTAKPNGLIVIKPGDVMEFLKPLGVREIPGIGPKTAEKLRVLRIDKVGDITKLSETELKNMFGKNGIEFYNKSRGIDDTPVVVESVAKSLGEEHTFEKDTRDPEIIFSVFERLISQVHETVLEHNLYFKTITVRCRFSGFETHTKSKTLDNPSQDFQTLSRESKKLLLRFMVENPKPIRLVGLRLVLK